MRPSGINGQRTEQHELILCVHAKVNLRVTTHQCPTSLCKGVSFSDVLSLVFSYVAHKLSRKKASLDQTFGLKRAELIAAFVNASTLIIVAFI